jgi:hypothetical protein
MTTLADIGFSAGTPRSSGNMLTSLADIGFQQEQPYHVVHRYVDVGKFVLYCG